MQLDILKNKVFLKNIKLLKINGKGKILSKIYQRLRWRNIYAVPHSLIDGLY